MHFWLSFSESWGFGVSNMWKFGLQKDLGFRLLGGIMRLARQSCKPNLAVAAALTGATPFPTDNRLNDQRHISTVWQNRIMSIAQLPIAAIAALLHRMLAYYPFVGQPLISSAPEQCFPDGLTASPHPLRTP